MIPTNLFFLLSFSTLLVSPLHSQEIQLAGAHWQKFAVPTRASLRGLSLPHTGIIWATGTGGTVLRTTDNGQTWRHIIVGKNPKLDFRDVYAIDAERAWIMGAGPGKASCIWQTESGGKEWRQVHVNALEGAFYDGMVFHQGEGLVYSDPVDGAFLLLRGDQNQWQRLKPKTMPPALEGEASFAASGSGIFRLSNHIWFGTGGATVARVFHSADGGETWTVVATPLQAGNPAAGVFSIAFRDPLNGVIVGGKYDAADDATANAAVTGDGGKSWQAAKKPPNGYRSCVTYIPETNTLIAVGTTGSDFSSDGGHIWRTLDPTPLNTVGFANTANSGWAVGPNGTVAHLRLKSR